jgi:hypothetical protein
VHCCGLKMSIIRNRWARQAGALLLVITIFANGPVAARNQAGASIHESICCDPPATKNVKIFDFPIGVKATNIIANRSFINNCEFAACLINDRNFLTWIKGEAVYSKFCNSRQSRWETIF